MSEDKPFKLDLTGTTAPPAIPVDDPDREEKIKAWRKKMERDESIRRRRE